MRVQAGGTGITWDLVALDPEHERDPGYHEYFLVLQAPEASRCVSALDFASTFRNRRGGLLDYVVPDTFHDVSVGWPTFSDSPSDCEAAPGIRRDG